MKNLIRVAGIILISLVILLIFSPYKHNKAISKKTIQYQLKIDVEKGKLFRYLGNSNHAKDWSDFVDHIDAINTEKVQDGQIGSIRRCFMNKNEKGLRWDESILEVIPGKSRTLNCFNLNGFLMQTDGILTQQIYKELPNGKTRSALGSASACLKRRSSSVSSNSPKFMRCCGRWIAGSRVPSWLPHPTRRYRG